MNNLKPFLPVCRKCPQYLPQGEYRTMKRDYYHLDYGTLPTVEAYDVQTVHNVCRVVDVRLYNEMYLSMDDPRFTVPEACSYVLEHTLNQPPFAHYGLSPHDRFGALGL